MKKDIILQTDGAAALIASVIVAAGLISVVLSTTIIALNNKASLESFVQATENFYNAESGVQEALSQVRQDPHGLIFNNLQFGQTIVSSSFVNGGSACIPPLVCDSRIETTATSTKASRKVRYTCNNNLANCSWTEVVP
ncbi:MAG: hypothetical protein UR94_C0019G0003 [Parcubacteria group bacterium GW2011_GWA2_36_10]|nr:MAG: hypothetical protein UR94_C0019G0003 [Parcubacteria group bacterium GW2011_GWA2_36_10]